MIKMRETREGDLGGLAKDFVAHKVSAAGVSYIVTERSRFRRILWFICVMACFLFMGYMTFKVINEYLRYPKVLIKEDAIFHKLPFPAVTVCSLNPISSHHISETSLKRILKLKSMMQNVSMERFNKSVRNHCYAKPLCKWSWFQEKCQCVENPCLTEFCLNENNTHCICSSFFCKSFTKRVDGCELIRIPSTPYSNETCLCEGTSTQDSWGGSFPEEDIQGLLDSIPEESVKNVIQIIKRSKTYDLVDVEEALMPSIYELYNYGVTFDSLVTSCSFQGNHCYRENFTVLYHPNYGKCYMFNYVGNEHSEVEEPIEIDRYGSTSGLQLLLRVSDSDAFDLLRREVGARIVIHDPHMLPFVAEYGVNVKPLDMTAVELSLSKIHRLGKPWGNCEGDTAGEDGHQDTKINEDPYSILGCEKYCGYRHMTKHCNCTMRHFLRGTVLNTIESSYPFCNISDKGQRDCVNKVSEDIENRTTCNCKPPCSETIYSYTVTASELNTKYYRTVKAIRTLNLDTTGQMKYMNYSDDKLMVGVKVYYNAFQVSRYKEVASYSWETLVANIGGNLGFFMGLTLVTFLEITEFIWDFIKTACSAAPPDNKIRKISTTSFDIRIANVIASETIYNFGDLLPNCGGILLPHDSLERTVSFNEHGVSESLQCYKKLSLR
ncbi:degenerin unc-8 [Caerostris darwini]|uniref:Degenerin unc-8 n=1 Tax=Caerostris darwini TaxID=1538125 RepID=A0AAV4P447_9ARAC|nr:degenerin unc-8 [Caerostris darwini]